VTTSPLHRGLATDRLIAEWYLDSPRVAAIIGKELPEPEAAPACIQIPAELETWKKSDSARVATVQARVRREFTECFQKGYAAFAVRITSAGPVYLLGPWSDF
jgi:predicted GNAT superfamily acetyltransferase